MNPLVTLTEHSHYAPSFHNNATDFVSNAGLNGELRASSTSDVLWQDPSERDQDTVLQLLSSIEPAIEPPVQKSLLQQGLQLISNTAAALTHWIDQIELLPGAAAQQAVMPKVQITTDNCDIPETLQFKSRCQVELKMDQSRPIRISAAHPQVKPVLQKASNQYDAIQPFIDQGKMFLIEDLEYHFVKRGLILDNEHDCAAFATIDYLPRHTDASSFLIGSATAIQQGAGDDAGYAVPDLRPNPHHHQQARPGDVVLLMDRSTGAGVPVHVGRVVEGPDGSLWMADKAGSGGYYFSDFDTWLCDNPIYRDLVDSAYVIRSPSRLEGGSQQSLQGLLTEALAGFLGGRLDGGSGRGEF